MKIMIVDQPALFREGVIDLIEDKPEIEIIKQDSERELVEQILVNKPAIVLMSGWLFEDGGKEMMQIILSQYPEIAFVILAPNENTELLLKVIRGGAKGYLSGTISEATLLKSLYAVERGEIAVSRALISGIVSEFQRVSERALNNESEKLIRLTHREMEVLRLLASDARNHEIGRQLFISNNTVRVHVHNILEKLQIKNRREAAKLAQRLSISTNGSPSNHGEKPDL